MTSDEESPIIDCSISVNGALKSFKIFESQVHRSLVHPDKHDHGELPPLKSSGPMASLVLALQDAKAVCDEVLTAELQLTAAVDKDLAVSPTKKPRNDG